MINTINVENNTSKYFSNQSDNIVNNTVKHYSKCLVGATVKTAVNVRILLH